MWTPSKLPMLITDWRGGSSFPRGSRRTSIIRLHPNTGRFGAILPGLSIRKIPPDEVVGMGVRDLDLDQRPGRRGAVVDQQPAVDLGRLSLEPALEQQFHLRQWPGDQRRKGPADEGEILLERDLLLGFEEGAVVALP